MKSAATVAHQQIGTLAPQPCAHLVERWRSNIDRHIRAHDTVCLHCRRSRSRKPAFASSLAPYSISTTGPGSDATTLRRHYFQ